MSSTPTPPSIAMPSEVPTSSPSPSLPRQPCRYLTSPGGCRYGDACRFIHPTDVLQQQSHQQPQHPSQMQSQMQPQMPIPMQPSHIPLQQQQQQQSQDPSSQSSPPPVQMAYPPGYPFYSPNEMNFEEGHTPYMYPPPPPHTQQHININMPPSPYQTPTPTHFPSPSLTPSPYQGPHLPPPYQASPSLQPFPATANSTYPQPPPQQLTPYQMYAYQYQQQQLIPYMQNAAHAYAAAGYTPQQQQQMLHQLAMSLQMMPPMNPPMEQRTMHLTRRDKNNINAQGMCKYYVAGKCNYGGTCRFPHDVMSAMAYQQANYGLTNGSPHPRTPQPQAQSDVDTLTETMDNVHLQSPPSSSRQRRNKSGSSSPSQQVCRYYHQGTCRFGDQCKFQHIEMTNPSTSTSSTSTSTSTPATYSDGDKLGTSNMDRQHVWKSLQITEKSSDIIDTTSSIPSSHTLIIYHSRFSSTHTFMDLVQHEHDACITFLHDLIEFLENVHGIMDYSIRIEQTVATEEEREECKEGDSSNINPTGSFRVRILYGGDLSNATTRTTPASDQLSKTLIHTTPHNRIWFDYHGRPALIITPQSHVERPSQLDDTQLYALLCDPITQLRREYEHVLAKSRRDEEEGEHELKEMITPRRLPPMTFQHLIINVGGYRRIRDLHIKMTLDPSLFTLIIATWPAALQQRWNAAQQSANTSNETTTTANNAGKKKPIKSASANKENRKSITNGTAPTTSGKGKPATILPQQQQQTNGGGGRGWASIVNKTTSTTPATTIAPSILPTSSYTNTSSSESSTSSSPNASPMTATRR